MKIYTKKGDAGETGLYGNVRVPKDTSRIRVYGTFDELNATLGLALSAAASLSPQNTQNGKTELSALTARLLRLQGELFQLGAEIATPRGKEVTTALIEVSHVEAMEKEIDEMESALPPLKTFILPGGHLLSSHLHVSRTVSRRAERDLVSLNRAEPLRPVVMQYVNRLSDYLFVCARFANFLAGCDDVPWVAPKTK